MNGRNEQLNSFVDWAKIQEPGTVNWDMVRGDFPELDIDVLSSEVDRGAEQKGAVLPFLSPVIAEKLAPEPVRFGEPSGEQARKVAFNALKDLGAFATWPIGVMEQLIHPAAKPTPEEVPGFLRGTKLERPGVVGKGFVDFMGAVGQSWLDILTGIALSPQALLGKLSPAEEERYRASLERLAEHPLIPLAGAAGAKALGKGFAPKKVGEIPVSVKAPPYVSKTAEFLKEAKWAVEKEPYPYNTLSMGVDFSGVGKLLKERKTGDFIRAAGLLYQATLKQVQKRVKTAPGRETMAEIDAVDRAGGTRTGTWGMKLRDADVFKLTEEGAVNLADVLEGGKAKSIDVQKAAWKTEPLLKTIFDEFDAVGGLVRELDGTLRPIRKVGKYFPRMLRKEIYEKVFADVASAVQEAKRLTAQGDMEGRIDSKVLGQRIDALAKSKAFSDVTLETLQHLQERGIVKTPGEALRYLNDYFTTELFNPFGNLERPRRLAFPAHFYERDARIVLDHYVRRAGKRVSEIERWGPNSERLTERLRQVRDIDPVESELLQTTLARFTGVGERVLPRYMQTLYDYFVAYEVMTKIGLGTATIPNMTQVSIFTIPWAGLLRSAKATAQLVRDSKMRQRVAMSGATSYEAMLMLAGYKPGIMGKPIPRTTMTVFNEVNRINKAVSAATADVYIGDLYRLANGEGTIPVAWFRNKRAGWAQKRLGELGVDYRQPLTERAKLEGMYRFATDTQLQRYVLKEPTAFNDPRFRPFVLFKRFGYRQFVGIKDLLIKEFRAGNVVPFLRLVAGGAIGGEFVIWAKNQLRSALTGRKVYREEDAIWKRILNDFTMVGALGMITDAAWMSDNYDDVAAMLRGKMESAKFLLTPIPIAETERAFKFAMATPSYFKTPEEAPVKEEPPLWRGLRKTGIRVARDIAPLFKYATGRLETVDDKRGRIGWLYKSFYNAVKKDKMEQMDAYARELASIGATAVTVRNSLKDRGATNEQILKATLLMNKYIKLSLPIQQQRTATKLERVLKESRR